jgi:hypothetical protein
MRACAHQTLPCSCRFDQLAAHEAPTAPAGVPPRALAPKLAVIGSRLNGAPICTQRRRCLRPWAATDTDTRTGRRCHICAGTGLSPATSAPGLGSLLRHLHRDWAHPCHICAGTGLVGDRWQRTPHVPPRRTPHGPPASPRRGSARLGRLVRTPRHGALPTVTRPFFGVEPGPCEAGGARGHVAGAHCGGAGGRKRRGAVLQCVDAGCAVLRRAELATARWECAQHEGFELEVSHATRRVIPRGHSGTAAVLWAHSCTACSR